MSRSGYTDDGDYAMWRGQVASAVRGRRGQAFLRDLLRALDEMPERRLIANDLRRDGEVCAIGSLGAVRGVDLESLDPEDYDSVAAAFDVAQQLVREVAFVNDEDHPRATPEERWQNVRSWVAGLIR